tara:strand:+ start:157 stop:423 length:267 start_codon:yes stop_codon:yes gene_type:complete
MILSVEQKNVPLKNKIMVTRRKRKSVPKDKKSRVPKKYLSGARGAKRTELASTIKRIAKLYKEGKTVPQSLIKRRIALGKKRGARKKN